MLRVLRGQAEIELLFSQGCLLVEVQGRSRKGFPADAVSLADAGTEENNERTNEDLADFAKSEPVSPKLHETWALPRDLPYRARPSRKVLSVNHSHRDFPELFVGQASSSQKAFPAP